MGFVVSMRCLKPQSGFHMLKSVASQRNKDLWLNGVTEFLFTARLKQKKKSK